MMISKKMMNKLNEQINNEQFSAQYYLAMAAAFEKMNLKIFAKRFYMQMAEENAHAMKIWKYVLDQGGEVAVKGIGDPKADWTTVEDIITAARDHEIKVTKMINDLMALAVEENDFATMSFLKWYIDEQVEEVSSMEELLALVKMAGPSQVLNLEYRLQATMG